MPCIGTNLAPFSSFNYLLPTGHDFAETLEPYDESQYKTFPKLYGGMQETPDIVTIPFSFFPDLPAALRNTLGAIRDVDIRLSGRVDNGLYAAYPIYVPFFLAEVEVIESNSPPWTTTVLIYAGKVNYCGACKDSKSQLTREYDASPSSQQAPLLPSL